MNRIGETKGADSLDGESLRFRPAAMLAHGGNYIEREREREKEREHDLVIHRPSFCLERAVRAGGVAVAQQADSARIPKPRCQSRARSASCSPVVVHRRLGFRTSSLQTAAL